MQAQRQRSHPPLSTGLTWWERKQRSAESLGYFQWSFLSSRNSSTCRGETWRLSTAPETSKMSTTAGTLWVLCQFVDGCVVCICFTALLVFHSRGICHRYCPLLWSTDFVSSCLLVNFYLSRQWRCLLKQSLVRIVSIQALAFCYSVLQMLSLKNNVVTKVVKESFWQVFVKRRYIRVWRWFQGKKGADYPL